ncbi:MAG: ABC transporter substrate-binding protein [Alphaproteobacteria bacterium]
MAFHRLSPAFVALIVAVLIALSARAEQEPPRILIDEFHAVLVNVMEEADSLGYDGRYDWLSPVVEDTFNLDFMARVTAGRFWKKASDQERERFVGAFGRMSVAIYASRFDDYAGEQFEVLAVESVPRESVLIKSNIVKKDGSKVAINYLLRQFDDEWRIIDIYLKGSISELATRKSEYSSILRRKGLEGLIVALDDKVATLAQESATP